MINCMASDKLRVNWSTITTAASAIFLKIALYPLQGFIDECNLQMEELSAYGSVSASSFNR